MGHRIIVMRDNEGHAEEPQSETYSKALEDAVDRMTVVGPRVFRAMKAQMMRDIEVPEEIKELGASQMFVLHSLTRGKALASELARLHNVTNPTMTRVIDTLVDKGYVERKHDEGDRRCIFLALTDNGTEVGREVELKFRGAMSNFLRSLTETQLNDISRAYSHLASLLREGNMDQEITDNFEPTMQRDNYEYSAK